MILSEMYQPLIYIPINGIKYKILIFEFMNRKTRALAFYLPQFYPTPENDMWWRKGFTDWTNVGRRTPLYRGHVQPKVPADLGYYDLRVPEVREQQAELARQAGIEGFCYWHYWFAGRRLLDRVFNEVVLSGKPNFPFCLCWANHSWYAKNWGGRQANRMLIEQTYPGEKDFVQQFYSMLPAFKDKRYIKVNNKPVYGIFSPTDFKKVAKLFFSTWNKLAKDNGFDGFYFFAFVTDEAQIREVKEEGYSSIVYDPIFEARENEKQNILKRIHSKFNIKIAKRPYPVPYDKYAKYCIQAFTNHQDTLPCIYPNFDHSPRSGYMALILDKSTPEKWERLITEINMKFCNRDKEENFLFIKAWNEWGEGNYLEPDLTFGTGYINATQNALKNI